MLMESSRSSIVPSSSENSHVSALSMTDAVSNMFSYDVGCITSRFRATSLSSMCGCACIGDTVVSMLAIT